MQSEFFLSKIYRWIQFWTLFDSKICCLWRACYHRQVWSFLSTISVFCIFIPYPNRIHRASRSTSPLLFSIVWQGEKNLDFPAGSHWFFQRKLKKVVTKEANFFLAKRLFDNLWSRKRPFSFLITPKKSWIETFHRKLPHA